MQATTLMRDSLPGIMSVIAVLVSTYSAFKAGHYRSRDVQFETVAQLYQRFYEIQALKVQFPQVSHLFTTSDTYESVKREVEVLLRHLPERERAECLLRERAVVSMLLTFHEQVVFQWSSAAGRERAFIKEVIDYMETRLFRNPRLLWWWTDEDVGLSASYEALTRSRWQRFVLAGVDRSGEGWRDAQGPGGRAVERVVLS